MNELVIGSAPLQLTPEEQKRWNEIAENNSRALDAMMRGEEVAFEDLTQVKKAQCSITNTLVSKIISAWDRRLLPLLLVLLLTCAPAEAKFRPLRFAKRAVCLTVGVATFPVLAPVNYVAQTALLHACYSRGSWRHAEYLLGDRVYDWYWLDRF